MINQDEKKNALNKIFATIFIISQFYWIYWIWIGIKNFIFGINAGWLIPSLANPNHIIFGFDTIDDSFAMAIITTIITPFIIIPIYQLIYLIVVIVRNIKTRKE